MRDPLVTLRLRGSDLAEAWSWLEHPPGDWSRAEGGEDHHDWGPSKRLRRTGGDLEGAGALLALDRERGVARLLDGKGPEGEAVGSELLASIGEQLASEVLWEYAEHLDVRVDPGGPASEAWGAPEEVAAALWRVCSLRPYRTKMTRDHRSAVQRLARIVDASDWEPPSDPEAMFLDLRFARPAAAPMADAYRAALEGAGPQGRGGP